MSRAFTLPAPPTPLLASFLVIQWYSCTTSGSLRISASLAADGLIDGGGGGGGGEGEGDGVDDGDGDGNGNGCSNLLFLAEAIAAAISEPSV